MKETQGKETRKKYKDTVFRLLYSEPERALSLYNSISGTDYKDPAMIQFNTLKNAIYMNVKNDLSFLVANQLSLYEQQSTTAPNMPLRDLFYIADIMQKMFLDRTIYSNKKIVIPNPNFVVFYNGQMKLPEKMELKLSDNFAVLTDDPALELKVTMLNINPGMNEDLKDKCPSLKEYMVYVETVRTYAGDMELNDAVERAVEECIDHNILKDFLLEQRAEVVKMSIYEYDEEREMKLIREDERDLGREEVLLLNKFLLEDNRIEDLRKATEDAAYREALREEYNIEQKINGFAEI
ncbi:MAG: hypothetical protein J6K58_02340 [Lachnospiraceae bacterium]|nr:hypothetical protein [Lachnospiraceae bacterium]